MDLSVDVGSVALSGPVVAASGTAGHGAELGAYFDLAGIGAVTVKSLAARPWGGNPAPRLHPLAAGMINSVGLQGDGVAAWLADDLPSLERSGAAVVVSIWGRSVEEFAEAAELVAGAPPCVVAVEVNLSCPNLAGKAMFAQDPEATRTVLAATRVAGRPRWAKLTAQVTDLVEVVDAAVDGGAEAVTLINTLPGMVIDVDERRPILGAGVGGVSGVGIHPMAVRAVWDVHAARSHVPIVGTGGVRELNDALEMLMAGASAVGVGTATFADPRACARLTADLHRWCARHEISRIHELRGVAHVR